MIFRTLAVISVLLVSTTANGFTQPATHLVQADPPKPSTGLPSENRSIGPGQPQTGTKDGLPIGAPPPAMAPAKKTFDPQKNCVDLTDASIELESGRRPTGPPIILDSTFLPTGGSVDVGVDKPFIEGTRYFAYVYQDRNHRLLLTRSNVSARRAAEGDALVKKGLLERDQTIVNLRISDSIAGFWKRADLFLYTCGVNGSPAQVSRLNVRLSSYTYSNIFSVVVGALAYLVAAFAFRNGPFGWQSLNPVRITAGIDGRGSLAKFQILLFSLLVFSLICLVLLRTGMLSELSSTILLLMGITGLGSTVAKGADASRTTITPENRAWLMRKGWLPLFRTGNADNAVWRDFFTTDGEFDVYRYQSFIFSLVVAGAMIAGGITQLSSFSIPETLLGVLGLSQAVYVGGKLVTPTTMTDLNNAVADLRVTEKNFRDAAVAAAAPDLRQAIALVGQNGYDAYRDKARDVAMLFTSQTGISVSNASLDPSISA